MMAFGDQLKRAREERGVSLEAVAKATRIAPRLLEALERSDLEGLPRGPFGKGYVRSYADFLGIDPQPILEAYRSHERQRGLGPADTQRRTVEELTQLMRQRSAVESRWFFSTRLLWGVLLLVALGFLGAGGWILFGREAPHGDVATSPAPASRTPRDAGATPEAPETDAPPETREADTPPERPEADPTPASAPREARVPETRVEAPAPAPDGPNPDLRVSHSGVGTGVESRRLVGRADRFVEGTEVSFWTRVLGGRPGDEIRHFWFHEDHVAMRADLAIGGSHWRTHSTLELPRGSTGSWIAEARSSDGRVLAHEEFLCVSEE